MSAIETPSSAIVGDSEAIRIPGAFGGSYDTGGGGGGTASYLVFESDGTSKLTLESGGGSLLLESSS